MARSKKDDAHQDDALTVTHDDTQDDTLTVTHDDAQEDTTTAANDENQDDTQDDTLSVTHVVAYMLLNALLTGASSERTVDGVTYNARVIDGETIHIVKATALNKLVTARDELRRAESRIAYLTSVVNVTQGRDDDGGIELFEASRKEKDSLVERCAEYRATIDGSKEEIVLSVPVGEFPTLVVVA